MRESSVDQLCFEQRSGWLAGVPVPVESILTRNPDLPADPEAVFDLVFNEYLLRCELGESPDPGEYAVRFPSLAGRLERQLELRRALDALTRSSSDPEWSGELSFSENGDQFRAGDDSPDFVFPGTDRYRIIRTLGRGGMGTVYEAWDGDWNQPVALKTLRHLSPNGVVRLKREFRHLADLTHPNLVTLYELSQVGDVPYFTMELVDGTDLLTHFQQHAGKDGEERWRLLQRLLGELASGLAALHRAGKLHCDVKPSNALVSRSGEVVLLDFGLTRSVEASRSPNLEALQGGGTAAYAPPEQLLGEPLGPSSDWYSLGAMLFIALTGRLPFQGTPDEILRAKRSLAAPDPASLAPGLPEGLVGLCVKLLQPDPARRPDEDEILGELGVAPSPARANEADAAEFGFLGRDDELAQLRAAFDDVGEHSHVALAHGRSGIGKSEFVEQFLRELAGRDDVLVLRGRCYEQESVPFKVFDNLLDDLSERLCGSGGQAAPLAIDDADVLSRMFPVMRRVRFASRSAEGPSATGELRALRKRAQTALRRLFERVATSRRIVLAIDDLQWGDLDSIDVLAEILAGEAPLFLIGTYRDEEADANPFLGALRALRPAIESRGRWREIPLGELSSETAAQLIRRRLHGTAVQSDETVRRIVDASRGVPFLIGQLCRAAAGGDADPDQARRSSFLPDEARRLLEVVAVAGYPLPIRNALEAAGLDDRPQSAVTLLRRKRLVRRTGGERDEARLEAAHDCIRESTVSALTDDARRAWHHALAVTLERSSEDPASDAERLAFHFLGAGCDEKTCGYAQIAADRAAESLAFEHAAGLYRLALDTNAIAAEERGDVAWKLGDAFYHAGKVAAAADAYQAALPDVRPERRPELLRRTADTLLQKGDFARGADVLRELLGNFGWSLPKSTPGAIVRVVGQGMRIAAYRRWPWKPWKQGTERQCLMIDALWTAAKLFDADVIKAYPAIRAHVYLSLRHGRPDQRSLAVSNEAIIAAMTFPPASHEIRRRYDDAARCAEECGRPYSRAMLRMAQAFRFMTAGRWSDCLAAADESRELYRTQVRGAWWEIDRIDQYRELALFQLGRFAALSSDVFALVRSAEYQDATFLSRVHRMQFANAAWLSADDVPEARRQLDQANASSVGRRLSLDGFFRIVAETHVALYSGEWEAAWRIVTAGFRELGRGVLSCPLVGMQMHALRAIAGVGVVPRLTGREASDAMTAVHESAAALDRSGIVGAMGVASLARGQLAALRRRPADAREEFKCALATFVESDMEFHAAAARHCLAGSVPEPQAGELRRAGEAWFAREKIASPRRFLRLLVPETSK